MRLAAMKRRIEAGDLWEMRRHIHNGPDRCQVMRLMQGRERYQLRQRCQDRAIQADGCGVLHPAMHDTVPNAGYRSSFEQSPADREQFAGGHVVVESLDRPVAFGDDVAIAVADLQLWRDADAFDLTAEPHADIGISVIKRELHARRSSVDHGDAAGHGNLSGNDVGAAVHVDRSTGDATCERGGEVGTGKAGIQSTGR